MTRIALSDSEITQTVLLEIARTTTDTRKASWCRTFAANLDLIASADAETRQRGIETLQTNADRCERLFVQPNTRG